MEEIESMVLDAMQWARQAGVIQLEYFRSGHLDVHTKLNESDIVTKADRASDNFLRHSIAEAYPGHSILTEESGEESNSGEYRWVIDPLDGTTNYTAGLPIFAVSIGIEHNGQTVGGVVYAPYLNELFHGIRGKGAWLNGEPIHVRNNDRMDRAVVATGFPVDKHINPDNNLLPFSRVLPHVRGVRRLGAASIDICYTAAGILDAYWEMNLHLWDVSAALLILEEAGGRHTFYRHDRNISVLATTPSLYDELLNLITQ